MGGGRGEKKGGRERERGGKGRGGKKNYMQLSHFLLLPHPYHQYPRPQYQYRTTISSSLPQHPSLTTPHLNHTTISPAPQVPKKGRKKSSEPNKHAVKEERKDGRKEERTEGRKGGRKESRKRGRKKGRKGERKESRKKERTDGRKGKGRTLRGAHRRL